MALDRDSLAALIEQQMGARGLTVETVPLHPRKTEYFWAALGDVLRQARTHPLLVAMMPEASDAMVREASDPVVRDRVGQLELA